jgi:hypothetical protein
MSGGEAAISNWRLENADLADNFGVGDMRDSSGVGK